MNVVTRARCVLVGLSKINIDTKIKRMGGRVRLCIFDEVITDPLCADTLSEILFPNVCVSMPSAGLSDLYEFFARLFFIHA